MENRVTGFENACTASNVETSRPTTTDCSNIPATRTANIVITVLVVILLVLGVVGNLCTLAVIIKNKNLQTNFNRFLISLCASDLVSACICSPLWLYRRTWGFSEWRWGAALCKFYWVTDFLTDFTTSLHILSFCILRFCAFSRPLTAPTSRFGVYHFQFYIAGLWTFSLIASLPHAFFMGVREVDTSDPWPSCSIRLKAQEKYHIYSAIVYSLFFYFPAALITILSIFTTRQLQKMTEARSALWQITDAARIQRIQQRNKSARLQLRLICICFIIGYVPVAAYLIWTSSAQVKNNCNVYVVDYWFGVVSYLILRVSECLNPVMYNLGCTEMRNATYEFVKKDVFRKASAAARAPGQRGEIILSNIVHSMGSIHREPV